MQLVRASITPPTFATTLQLMKSTSDAALLASDVPRKQDQELRATRNIPPTPTVLGLRIPGNGDGYTYIYANSYHNGMANIQSNQVVLAHVPKAQVFNLNTYEYCHESSLTKDRIYISNLSDSSAENLVGLDNVDQDTAFYSTHYKTFIYFNMGISLDNRNLYAWTADNPQGAWSNRSTLYSDPLPEPPSGFDYGGYIVPKFMSSDGKTIFLSWTRGAYYKAVIEITFA